MMVITNRRLTYSRIETDKNSLPKVIKKSPKSKRYPNTIIKIVPEFAQWISPCSFRCLHKHRFVVLKLRSSCCLLFVTAATHFDKGYAYIRFSMGLCQYLLV